jgi:hypothetical protein
VADYDFGSSVELNSPQYVSVDETGGMYQELTSVTTPDSISTDQSTEPSKVGAVGKW